MNGDTVMIARGWNLWAEGHAECPLPFADFSLTHLTRGQKRRGRSGAMRLSRDYLAGVLDRLSLLFPFASKSICFRALS